jgi:hypothetical protein
MTFCWVHISYYVCVIDVVSSFQKPIMNPLFFLNVSIFCNTIPYKVYCNIGNKKIDNVVVKYDFTF